MACEIGQWNKKLILAGSRYCNRKIVYDMSSFFYVFICALLAVSAAEAQNRGLKSPKPEANLVTQHAISPGTVFRDCDVCPVMVGISAGSFVMGSPSSEKFGAGSEEPQRTVYISYSFAAGKYEVTFDEWESCVRENGCMRKPYDKDWGRGNRPVINISWTDTKQYTQWLSTKTGKEYRLPSESEWEYVARAGTNTAFNTGDNINPHQANYDTSESYAGSLTSAWRMQTLPVGSYPPNAFGLHDVHGNAWEWVEDCWNANYNGAPTDGSAWAQGDCSHRVMRGGSWSLHPRDLRSAIRSREPVSSGDNYLGFRVLRMK